MTKLACRHVPLLAFLGAHQHKGQATLNIVRNKAATGENKLFQKAQAIGLLIYSMKQ